MVMADLFPPGRVLWAIRDGDLHPSHRLSAGSGTSDSHAESKVRLFEVNDVEKMFGQIIFARDMLRWDALPFTVLSSSNHPFLWDYVARTFLINMIGFCTSCCSLRFALCGSS